MEYEKIREQKRLFDAELAKHEVELGAMLEEHGRLSGHQSEPTTPPEYRENPSGFPSVFSRPNRYSLSSLTSPPGLANRSARSGSVLASPQSGVPLSRFAFDDQLPSWSVPGSRRNSDEDEKEEAVRQDPTSHRSTNAYVEPFSSDLVEIAFAASCLRCPFFSVDPMRDPGRCSDWYGTVAVRDYASRTLPWAGLCRVSSLSKDTPSMRMCQHCTPSVLIPLRIALLLSMLAIRVTVFLLGHTCPSFEESLARPISMWKGAPLYLTFPSNCSTSHQRVYFNPLCPRGIQRYGPTTQSSYCSSSYSSSESSGPLLSRHLLPRYLKSQPLIPCLCFLPSFSPYLQGRGEEKANSTTSSHIEATCLWSAHLLTSHTPDILS